MRAKAGWGVSILGILVVLLGIAMMIYLGPDGRRTSGPHPVETDGIAIVTAPKALSWAGLRIDVLAELPANKPVFVGLGNAVDVDDYIGKTSRLEVDRFHVPWTVKTRTVDGESNLPAAPTSVDWWIASGAGLGGASIDTTLPDETVRLAILSVGSSNLRGLTVSVAYGIKGGFAKGAGLVLLGLGAIWFGLMLRRGDPLWPVREEFEELEIEEVVYVYIDDDGVEHEISAEEAEQYEIEDIAVDEAAPEPGPDIEPEPEPSPVAQKLPEAKRKRWSRFTAGEIAKEQPEPDPIPEVVLEVKTPPKPTTSPEPAPKAPPVVYVFVDDDGIEHEVGEDELHDYELVEDDEGEERP